MDKGIIVYRRLRVFSFWKTILLSKTQDLAVKRHPSGDLTLVTSDRGSTEHIIEHRAYWQKILGEKAEVKVPSYRIIIHRVSTQMEAHKKLDFPTN